MYEIDDKDKVVQLKGVPRPEAGAPMPVVLATESVLFLVYYKGLVPNYDDHIVVVRFPGCLSHMFGIPNDEAFRGHPLYERGLEHYAVFEIRSSSWVRRLEQVNSVHPHHNKKEFLKFKHFIFAFHDSTFECVASGFDVQAEEEHSMGDVVLDICNQMSREM